MQRKTLTFSFQVKAIDDEQGLIEAYGSVFNNTDEGNDVVRPGAFKRTIKNAKSKIAAGKAKFLSPMLWQHDPERPIGGWYDLVEDSYGLLCKGQIILSTQLGRDVYELIKARVIDQFSIGYDIPDGGSTWNSKDQVRELKELRLWEISVVTFAMNPEALLQNVKGASGGSFPLTTQDTTWNKNEDNGKSREISMNQKDFNDHYRIECIQDWYYSDFQNLVCALKAACTDIFTIGDEPQSDVISTILEDSDDNKMGFASALEAWVQKGINLDASNYLPDMLGYNSPGYGYMSNDAILERKSGRAISAANAAKIQAHIDNLKSIAKEHMKSLNAAADDLATQLQGSEAAYETDSGDPAPGQQEGKTVSYAGIHGAHTRSLDSTVDEQELEAALSALRSLNA